MAIGDRLLRLKAAAEARGPLEPRANTYDNEFEPQKIIIPRLPPPDVLDPESAEDRAHAASRCAGLDCETFLIQPGRNTPRLVVTGYQSSDGRQAIVTGDRLDPTVHARAFLLFTDHIIRYANNVDDVRLDPLGNLLVNQNIAFDFAVIAEDAHQCDVILGKGDGPESLCQQVMQRIFDLLDRRLVEDTMLRERLIDLAEGSLGKDFGSLTDAGNPRRKKYSLQGLAQFYLDLDLDKTTWRTGYARLLNKPIEEYEQGARDYVTSDVATALHVASRQTTRATMHGLPPGERIPNSAEQSKAAFAFQLMSSWGIRTNLSKVQKLDADLDRTAQELLRVLRSTSLIRADGTRDMKATQALVAKCYEEAGLVVPMTESGKNVSTAGSVLEDITLIRLRGSSADVYDEKGQIDETALMKEPLYAYSQFSSIQKLQNTYLPVLYSGAQHPINARFETIVETGRASCYKPNLMNLPRGGKKTLLQRLQSRVRECFVPRPGFVFCSVDYNTLELCTLAQVCVWMIGYSKLADAINAGIDPHTLMAAEQFLHIPYEEAVAKKKEKFVEEMRQLVKALNFGLPGGLSARTFTDFAKASYNVYVTEDEARALKEKWFAQWPEMRPYFRMIAAMMKGFDDKGQSIGDIEQFVSGRIRGRTRYTAAANGFFQGLAADGAKTALYDLQKASYLKDGALYGSRAVAFIHDEVIMEHPEETASERAQIQAEMMVRSMQDICPDVKISASPALMRCWRKGADAVYDFKGKLIPWEPSE